MQQFMITHALCRIRVSYRPPWLLLRDCLL